MNDLIAVEKIAQWQKLKTLVLASLLSELTLYNSFPASADLVENDIGSGFPDKRAGLVIPGGQPLIDRALKFSHAVEGSSANHSVGNESEETFDLVEPGTARGGEVKKEAASLFRLQPALDGRTFVRGIVVHDEVSLLFRPQLLFQLVEKLDELLGPMTW